MKEYLVGRLVSTNAWVALIMIVALLLLPKTITLTLLVIFFFIPDGLVSKAIAQHAPGIQRKIMEWSA